ncbi:hypothetical protein EC991_006509 [Linnemannia zychae]|nr:hypothetical protein EC991_006509 [Linnemannia zychae]
METAFDRFKDLPELIHTVASFLEHKDIPSFRLTCRMFHDISNHFFYRDILLNSCWTQEGLQLLAKYARFVCYFLSSEKNCANYYSSISHTLRDSAKPASSDNAISTPNSSSSPTLRQFTSAAQLVSFLSHETLYALCSRNCFPAKFLYVASLSPRLTTLLLNPIKINTHLNLNVFSRTLSSINNLQSLAIWIHTDHLNAESILKALVYSAPSSLELFSLVLESLDDGDVEFSDAEDLDDKDDHLSDTVSTLLGPITERKKPLGRLTDWKLTNNIGDIDADMFISLLEFLPELTSMDVPSIGFQAPVYTFDVATRISKACPKLKKLSKQHTLTDQEGMMALALLHKMPANTVEYLQISWLLEDVRTFGVGLEFHKESIKRIIFDKCQWIVAESLASIFFQCSVLEVFEFWICPDSPLKIRLEDLVRRQWASNKFTDLMLCLELPINHQEARQPTEPNISIPSWAVDLERFYRQIGILTSLRRLNLKATVPRRSMTYLSLITHRGPTFAGMLTLEDRTVGRHGWLQLLGGLKNLEELRGSFNIGVMVAGFEFGQREADWIVDHWSKLRFIELYTYYTPFQDIVVDYPPSVQSMVARLPGLKVVQPY